MLKAILAILAAVGLDQAVKYWAVTVLKPIRSIPVIEGVFHLTYAENPGMAFSLLEGQRWFFVVLTLLVLVGFVWVLKKDLVTDKIQRWCMILVMGGAIGNFIDRIFNDGKVIDMFYIKLIDFPIFNVADLFVTMPGALFCLLLVKEILEEEKAKKAQKAAAEEQNDDQDSGQP